MGAVGKAVGAITKPIGGIVGGITGGLGSGAQQNNFQYNPYQFNEGVYNNNQVVAQNLSDWRTAAGNAQSGGLNPALNTGGQAAVEQLTNQITGQAPSVAQIQLQQSQQQLQNQLGSQLASTRGVNAGLAQRNYMNALAQGGSNLAGQGALLRAQEQQGASNSLLSAYAQNQQATNQAVQYYTSLGYSQQQAQQAAQQDLEKLKSQQNNYAQTGNAAIAAANFEEKQKQAGGIFNTLSGTTGLSLGNIMKTGGGIAGGIFGGPVGAAVGSAAGGALGGKA